jgi:hypothetical protein
VLEGNDLDLEGAHAFTHSSSEFSPQFNKAIRARINSWNPRKRTRRITMRESAKKRVTLIEVRLATRDDYQKTAYQVGTLYRAARPKSTKATADTVPSSGASTSW